MKKFYTSDNHGLIMVIDEVISFIPFDPANSDYQDYLGFLAEGNILESWEKINGAI